MPFIYFQQHLTNEMGLESYTPKLRYIDQTAATPVQRNQKRGPDAVLFVCQILKVLQRLPKWMKTGLLQKHAR